MCHSNGVSTWGIQGRRGEAVKKVEFVRFRTYSIQNGRNGGLESALRGMDQSHVGLGLLQDINIIYGVYS